MKFSFGKIKWDSEKKFKWHSEKLQKSCNPPLKPISEMRQECVICGKGLDAQFADAVACAMGGLRLGVDESFACCRFDLPLRGRDCRLARYVVILRTSPPARHDSQSLKFGKDI